MDSIDYTQPNANQQTPPCAPYTEPTSKRKDIALKADLFKELGISNEQFKILFNNLPQGYALYKISYRQGAPIDFTLLDFNDACERILGITREPIVWKKVMQSFPTIKSEPVDWLGVYGRVATTGVPEQFEIYCPVKDKFYQVYVYSPKKGYCVSVFMDTTLPKKRLIEQLAERKKVEERLKDSAEKYRYLLEYAPTGIYELDFDGPKFMSVNAAMCQITGYREQELLAMNPFDLLYDESKKRFQERISNVVGRKKGDEAVEYHIKTKDGRGFWGILNVKLTFKYGRVQGALVVAQDITARKRAEQELISTEERYRRLYETSQDGIMARDLKGKMIDCNQAYAKMLGYTKKELKRLTVQQLLPENWHEQRDKVVNKVLQTGRSQVFEREYKRKDGSVFPASVRTWRLTNEKGKVIGIWSIVRDITEQKELQRNLEEHAVTLTKIIEDRTKQLKDSERLAAIGQTAGMVGHDLRNPLQTVLGELYLARAEVESLTEGALKKNLQESIRTIEEQAIYMDKIVSDLQAFVKPVKIDKTSFNMKELITAILVSVNIPTNVSVETKIEENASPIKADLHLLKRVLINLVTNAVQAMPNGGKLTITSQVNHEKSQASVTVQDTGVGISEAIKPQIFTPLFTTKSRGQGFGLAVCKRVIEAHGGTICFESTEGKGTKFAIKLPSS